jgi:UPF0755 protein
MRRAARLALFAGLIGLGSVGIVAWLAVRSLDEPLHLSASIRYKVAPGARFAHVAADLGAEGVVAYPRAWIVFARWKGQAAAVKAGEYAIDPGLTPRSLLAKMVKGDVVLHGFTIVDGWRVEDMLAALRRNPNAVQTLPAQPGDLMAVLGFPGVQAEGQFLPETYKFESGTTDVQLLRQAHGALARELATDWADRDPNLTLANPGELLTLASIVEKESAVPQELPKIAGLYLHRLTLGMRLQADPTLIYGLGSRYDGSLHTIDLRTDGPFNSYTRTGLPPTPICLPSAAALRATAHPEQSDAIYFVASGKADGTHVFSATLAEQNAAVTHYLAVQRQKTAAGTSR